MKNTLIIEELLNDIMTDGTKEKLIKEIEKYNSKELNEKLSKLLYYKSKIFMIEMIDYWSSFEKEKYLEYNSLVTQLEKEIVKKVKEIEDKKRIEL